MSARLQCEVARYAETISRRNPIAFPGAESVRAWASRAYAEMRADRDINMMATGGLMLRRDGDGDVELWAKPFLLEDGQ